MPVRPVRTSRWARPLLAVSIALAAWAVVIVATGGVRFDLGPLRISSRNAARVFLIALVPAALAWRLGYESWLAERIDAWLPALRRAAPIAAVILAVVVLAMGVRYGTRAAAAADPSGYVSQSALWVRGTLRIDQSFTASLPWPGAEHAFAPLGYRAGAGGAMVPTYAPGVPLMMGALRLLTLCGPYLVGPLCGALLVFFTFRLGRDVFGAASGLSGAVLVACSPVVLFMTFVPMADVPAAACWIAALSLAVRASPRSALAAGLATGAAVLVRPNLVPLAVFPWAMALLRAGSIPRAASRTLAFAAGSVPAALFIGWLNAHLYGSPFTSGYGDLGEAFQARFASANLRNYSAWWLESQGPLAFLFVVALVRRSAERAVLIGFGAALWLLYLFYLPFEAWWFLRFLLPAVPLAFLFSADVVSWAGRRSRALRLVALTAFIAVAGAQAARFVDTNDITAVGAGDDRYVEAALYVAGHTAPDAVVLAMQHSGSLRYHAGRLTLRWDLLDPEWLDRAVAHLHERGIATYALLESWEETRFRDRFRGQAALAELDRGALATAREGEIRLYPLAAPESGTSRVPTVIPQRIGRTCLDIAPGYVMPPAVRRLRSERAE